MIKEERICAGRRLLDIAYMSDIGGRPVNEDAVAVAHNDRGVLLVAADGLGAHGGGDVAAGIAVEVVSEKYLGAKRLGARTVCGIFKCVDDAIVKRQTESLSMKTTLSCLMCRGRHMYAAHLGDTRIYVFKNGKLMYFTADHSAAYEEVMRFGGTADDIRRSPNRHILTAALGVVDIRRPDMFREKMKSGTSVLMCSDGFWEHIREEDMEKTLNATKSSSEWLGLMTELHRERACGQCDNYSAIGLRII